VYTLSRFNLQYAKPTQKLARQRIHLPLATSIKMRKIVLLIIAAVTFTISCSKSETDLEPHDLLTKSEWIGILETFYSEDGFYYIGQQTINDQKIRFKNDNTGYISRSDNIIKTFEWSLNNDNAKLTITSDDGQEIWDLRLLTIRFLNFTKNETIDIIGSDNDVLTEANYKRY